MQPIIVELTVRTWERLLYKEAAAVIKIEFRLKIDKKMMEDQKLSYWIKKCSIQTLHYSK